MTTKRLAPHIRACGELTDRALNVLCEIEANRSHAWDARLDAQHAALMTAARYVIEAVTGEILSDNDVHKVLTAARQT